MSLESFCSILRIDTPTYSLPSAHAMADGVTIDYETFRHVGQIDYGQETTAEKASRLLKEESQLDTMLQMPMYKNLPITGFRYDWKQFYDTDGLFTLESKRSRRMKKAFNDHVQDLDAENMDRFCAELSNKATARLDDLSDTAAADFWGYVAKEIGIHNPADTAENLVVWDWAMKLVAARTICSQEDKNEKVDELLGSDTGGDTTMADQPNKKSQLKLLSLAAQAVDKFLSVGISKYGGRPEKLKAIMRHHVIIGSDKNCPEKTSRKGSAAAENAALNKLYLPVNVAPRIENGFRIRKARFGSQVSVGNPAWWGCINRFTSSNGTSGPQQSLAAPEVHSESTSHSHKIDDLIIGIHSTNIQSTPAAPQILVNLALRTNNPLKRPRNDPEGAEDGGSGNQKPVKVLKTSLGHTSASDSSSQKHDPQA
ncbi:hypothetical protein J7T55_002835 [Diaporthe amygdali]|uniref:uncharacterized protein n=1 Tax=Phomopsis amygdali TaxID=1214568 RepID=UPI0022FE9AFF|nr:uncharacterized protein J7T55_002835 [Diaporthe amygdali]KAJ0122322.1 hypothetical protein J7T55_002835 [Diaporthe amygdali]